MLDKANAFSVQMPLQAVGLNMQPLSWNGKLPSLLHLSFGDPIAPLQH